MAGRLFNVVRFVGVAPGAAVVLPHNLNWNTLAVVPDVILPSVAGFTITATNVNVSVTNNELFAASVDCLCWSIHTDDRAFGAVQTVVLTPQPFVPTYGASAIGFAPARTIFVAQSGGHATSIAAGIALAAALAPAPSAADPATVLVFPGVYPEAPFAIPAFVSLIGMGGTDATVIQATTATAPLITGMTGALAQGFTLQGANGVGGVGIFHSAAGTFTCRTLIIRDCTTAVRATGAGVILIIIDATVIRVPGETLTTAYRCDTGANLNAASVRAFGVVGTTIAVGFDVDGAGSELVAQGVVCVDVDDPLRAGGGGLLNVNSGEVRRPINGFHVLANGTIDATAIEIEDGSGFDLLVDAASSTFRGVANAIRTDRISVAVGSSVLSSALSEFPGDLAQVILGELQVGSPEKPTESVFGEGDSHVRGMAVFRNTNLEIGAWSDITTEMASATGSTAAALPGVGVGNTFYIGGDIAFPGFKVNTTIAIALGAGALVVEFHNGAAWTVFNIMAADSVVPYDSHAQDIWGRVATEQIRFGPMPGWAVRNLNGTIKFWIRVRVSAGITTVPTLEQTKLGTNRTEINADGFIERFGIAEDQRSFFHQRLTDDLSGASPVNGALVLSANITITPIDNRFNNNALDGFGAIEALPEGLDTSRPVELVVNWIPKVATAGDVELEINVAQLAIGDVLDGSVGDVNTAVVTAVGAAQTNILRQTVIAFSIVDLLPSEFFAFSLFRDATGGNPQDTLAGAIDVASIQLRAIFWR